MCIFKSCISTRARVAPGGRFRLHINRLRTQQFHVDCMGVSFSLLLWLKFLFVSCMVIVDNIVATVVYTNNVPFFCACFSKQTVFCLVYIFLPNKIYNKFVFPTLKITLLFFGNRLIYFPIYLHTILTITVLSIQVPKLTRRNVPFSILDSTI